MRDYNFFEAYQKKRSLSIDLKSPVILGTIAIIIILLFSGGLFTRNIILGTNYALKAQELSEIQASDEYQKAQELQNKISAMTEYDQDAAAALNRIKQGDILNTKFLNQLSQAMPSNVSLTTANLTRQSANFTFSVPDRKAAAELYQNLDQSGLFLQTTLVSVSSNSDTPGYMTQISGVIKAGEKE